MNPIFLAFVFLFGALVPIPFSLHAQETDKEVDDAVQQAADAAKKMGVKIPDVKKQMEEVDKEEAKEKAALQKQLEAPGRVALPDWTPEVPQFKPAGPAIKKVVDDEVDIIMAGTSPLTPAELGDSWEAAKGDKLNSSRTNGSYNDTKVVTIYLSTREEPLQKVILEATRAPEEKITHVTISSPLPKPEVEED
ncbi:MAG: hypothetical protein DME46_04580 [Verrucomicrobia bacterium]|nr:MAG: hypothetical protein DME46_04580 [Verrucomicrobiota bacterium]